MSTLAERFERLTVRDANSGCILWRGSIGWHGYGTLSLDGKTQRAHRVAWAMRNGRIPDGLMVLHACDNRACVNPEHLSLGTNRDNEHDKITKGRRAEQTRTTCKRGHPRVSRGVCRECIRATSPERCRRYRERHLEERRAADRDAWHRRKANKKVTNG